MDIKKKNDCPLGTLNFIDGNVIKGISQRSMSSSEKMSCNVTYFKKGSMFETHKHQTEELGFVVSGKLKIVSHNDEFILEEGDTYLFTEKVEHRIEALENSEVVTVFALST